MTFTTNFELEPEEGPHDELMARGGTYFRLYEAQARNVDTEVGLAHREAWVEPVTAKMA